MLHRDFNAFMEREWQWTWSLSKSLKELAKKLQAWNMDTFGNIFKRKRLNEARLTGFQKLLERKATEGC